MGDSTDTKAVALTKAQWDEVLDALILWEEGFLEDGDDEAAAAANGIISAIADQVAENQATYTGYDGRRYDAKGPVSP